VIARDEGNNLDVIAGEAEDLAIEDDILRVFVVVSVADKSTTFVKNCGDVQE
jgi:phage shock protein PspC (stress-responsive transcriptional regulator)